MKCTQYSNLIFPITVDLAGQNGQPVFVKLIDLERQLSSVKNDLSNLIYLKEAVEDSERFVVSAEPKKDLADQHQWWENIRNSSLFEYIDISEKEKLHISEAPI